MIKEQFFPTRIYGKDIKLDNSLFEHEIIEWSKRDPGVKKTNRNGWHSTTEMHKIPVFKSTSFAYIRVGKNPSAII